MSVLTSVQSNAYRQLVAKEALRRRNAAAVMSEYEYTNHVVPMSNLAPHWDGAVLNPRTGGLDTPLDTLQVDAATDAAKSVDPGSAGSGSRGARELLRAQHQSSVLREGYNRKANSESRAVFSNENAIGTATFENLNEQMKAPHTRSRKRAESRKFYEEANERRYAREAERAQRTAADRLRDKRLMEVGLSPSFDPTPTLAAREGIDSAKEGAPAHHHGSTPALRLRSLDRPAFPPMPAHVRAALNQKANQVFQPIPLVPYVAAARARTAEAQARLNNDLLDPVDSLPSRARPASQPTADDAPELKSQLQNETPHADLEHQQHEDKVEQLERMLEATRATRQNLNAELVELTRQAERSASKPLVRRASPTRPKRRPPTRKATSPARGRSAARDATAMGPRSTPWASRF